LERLVPRAAFFAGFRQTDVGLADWTAVFYSRATELLPLVQSRPRLANARGMSIPTSIDRLFPKSLLFKVYDGLAIRSPHRSIIGDRGRGDTPNSSDGVVPYWSSHLDTARSELIVPTGHGAMNSPLAIAEIQRILRLNAGVAILPSRADADCQSSRPLTHLLSKVYQQLIGSIDSNKSDTRKFEVYDDVNRHGDHNREYNDMQPTAPLRFGHPVSGDQ
jgi:hypothetical protein